MQTFFSNIKNYFNEWKYSLLFKKENTFSQKILCVDDDEEFCRYIRQLAYALEINVETAYTLQEAKEKILQFNQYDAYIIDGHLPDGSGFELISWLRQEQKITAPIGFLSRIYQDAASFRRLKEGYDVNYVLDKPLQPEQVNQLLNQLCLAKADPDLTEPFPDEILVSLKENYKKTIPDKVEKIEKRILKLQKHPTVDNLKELQEEIHKIAGSAGSHGYMAVSELCKELEKEMTYQSLLAETQGINPSWLSSLDEFFTRFKHYFQV